MGNKGSRIKIEFFKTLLLFSALLLSTCTKKPEGSISVTTKTVTDITENSAKTGGSVTCSGYSIGNCGVCYGENHNPTLDDNFTKDLEGSGTFNSTLNNLKSCTKYYVRAYAKTSSGVEYGDEIAFVTNGVYNGHNYVDLGLPSGTLWASCNVGATTPEGYGDYFAWGETTSKMSYNWNTYKYCNGNENSLIKYCNDAYYGYNGFIDNLTVLQTADDAAMTNWGSGWQTPTLNDWRELCNNTTITWKSQNNVRGCMFTSNNGGVLFLPASGEYSNNYLSGDGYDCWYWSSNLYTEWTIAAGIFSNYANDVSYQYRYVGLPVRPVHHN